MATAGSTWPNSNCKSTAQSVSSSQIIIIDVFGLLAIDTSGRLIIGGH